jgi:hypothetical protein
MARLAPLFAASHVTAGRGRIEWKSLVMADWVLGRSRKRPVSETLFSRYSEFRTRFRVHKHSDSECYVPPSEPFTVYFRFITWHSTLRLCYCSLQGSVIHLQFLYYIFNTSSCLKSGGTEIEWDTSASGLCWWSESTGREHRYHK